jgi:voltage-gated sodium channel
MLHLVTAVFVLEAVLKIVAKGERPHEYFEDNWNKFDFIIVISCVIPYVLPLILSHSTVRGGSGGTVGLEGLAILRLLRLLRALKLLNAVPQLQIIVTALLKGLSSMGYIAMMIVLVNSEK